MQMSKHDQQCLLSWSRAAGLAYGGLVLSIVLLWLSLAPSRQGIQRAPTRRSPPTGGRAIDGDPRRRGFQRRRRRRHEPGSVPNRRRLLARRR